MRTLTWQWIAAEDPWARASEPVEQQQHRLLAGADVIAVKRDLVGHVQNCDECGQPLQAEPKHTCTITDHPNLSRKTQLSTYDPILHCSRMSRAGTAQTYLDQLIWTCEWFTP